MGRGWIWCLSGLHLAYTYARTNNRRRLKVNWTERAVNMRNKETLLSGWLLEFEDADEEKGNKWRWVGREARFRCPTPSAGIKIEGNFKVRCTIVARMGSYFVRSAPAVKWDIKTWRRHHRWFCGWWSTGLDTNLNEFVEVSPLTGKVLDRANMYFFFNLGPKASSISCLNDISVVLSIYIR